MQIIFCNLKSKWPRFNMFIALTRNKGQKFKDTPRHVGFKIGDDIYQMKPSKGLEVIPYTEWWPNYKIIATAKYLGDVKDEQFEVNLLDQYHHGTKYDQKAIIYLTWRVTMKVLGIFKNILPKHGKNKLNNMEQSHCVELADGLMGLIPSYSGKYSVEKGSHSIVTPNEFLTRLNTCKEFDVTYSI